MTTPVEDSIGATLESVLEAIVATYEQANVDLPHKQYITAGQTAHDCEQLTVSFIQMYLGPPGQQAEEPQRCNAPRSVVMEIQVARKLPEPLARQVAASAEATTDMTHHLMRDAWLLMDAATQGVDGWAGVIADVSVTNPAGGYQAVVLNLVSAVA